MVITMGIWGTWHCVWYDKYDNESMISMISMGIWSTWHGVWYDNATMMISMDIWGKCEQYMEIKTVAQFVIAI